VESSPCTHQSGNGFHGGSGGGGFSGPGYLLVVQVTLLVQHLVKEIMVEMVLQLLNLQVVEEVGAGWNRCNTTSGGGGNGGAGTASSITGSSVTRAGGGGGGAGY
jgi:hypothetical protein